MSLIADTTASNACGWSLSLLADGSGVSSVSKWRTPATSVAASALSNARVENGVTLDSTMSTSQTTNNVSANENTAAGDPLHVTSLLRRSEPAVTPPTNIVPNKTATIFKAELRDLKVAATSVVSELDSSVTRLQTYVVAQSERQRANAELKSELSRLWKCFEVSFSIAEVHKKTAEWLGVANYQHYPKEGEKFTLIGLADTQTGRSGLPDLALAERVELFQDALRRLDGIADRLKKDPSFADALNRSVTTPIDVFIEGQRGVLNRRLAALKLPERTTSGAKTVKLTSDSLLKLLASVEAPNGSLSIKGAVAAITTQPSEFSPGVKADGETRLVQIKRIIDERQIPHLVHFTRCENLASIVRSGIMSVSTTEARDLGAMRNDQGRYDGQLDGISLSVAFPNYRMFYKYRQATPGSDWAVLLISTRVLWQLDCAFYCHNAADSRMISQSREQMKSAQSLTEMFGSGEGREAHLRPCDPTDAQAEIMVYETIDPKYIEAVAFETKEARSRHKNVLGGLSSFYAGPNRGLFAARTVGLAN